MKTIKQFVPVILFLLMNFNVGAQESKKSEDVFYVVEEMPEYPGGEEALRHDIAKAIKYPDEARKNGISGKVYITFIVNEVGKVEGLKVARGVDPVLDKEALRVMGLLKKWKPGKQKGVAVKVSYTCPINFALKDNKKKEEPKETKRADGVYLVVDEMPEYPGGELALRKAIANNVKYPVDAQKEGISGKVYVSFVVNEEGKVESPEIVRGVHPSLDKESMRVINLLENWKPGKQDGKAVKVAYTVPINYALNDNSKNNSKMVSDEGDPVFFIVEEMPVFPGGEDALKKYISENLNYPETAKKKGIQGKVYVSFTVAKDGSVQQVTLERGVDPALDKEALRVISVLPAWQAGKQRGKNVNVRYTIPINFELGAK